MKKIVALLLAIVMVVGIFAGCNTDKPVETKPQETKPAETKPAETQPAETEPAPLHPVTTEPITIKILTTRHTNTTNEARDTWFFNHLEKWLHDEYGYNVTLDVQQNTEYKEQIPLLLGTDSLPDLLWGIALDNSQAVVYGMGEGMILDWSEYLNETYMPNAYARMYDPQNADALAASTAPDGGIYGLPQLTDRAYNNASSSIGGSQDRMFFNTTWLKEVGLELPTNLEELYAVLEAFQNLPKVDGQDVIPIISNKDILEKTLWTMLGFYGGVHSKYGTAFAIKDEQVQLPVYTEEYKTFIEIMNKMYTEGYLSPEHFTMDATTVRGLTKAGNVGVISDFTLGFVPDYTEWQTLPWFPINEGDQIVISTNSTYRVANTWASASTEYPEVLALILDYMYTEEGSIAYFYGPKQGEDELGLVDGWYYDENGKRTTKLVADGVYGDYSSYCYQYIFSVEYVAGDKTLLSSDKAYELLGMSDSAPKSYQILDTITGDYFTAVESTVYTDDNAQGYWFLNNSAVSRPHITTVFLPSVYLSEEDALNAADLKTLLENHIISESAKFITGQRPLDQLDAFQDELKGLGIEEYIALYQDAYADFMDSIFG